MKLINHTLLFLSAILFVTVSLWALLFYFQLLNEVKTTIDNGLANYKIVIIDKVKNDSNIVQHDSIAENNYLIKRVSEEYALVVRDSYKDTMIYSKIRDSFYRTRLLTTAFISNEGKYYEMKVISQELDRNELIEKLATSLLWLYLFLFVSTILLNNFVLKNTWKPFYRLLNFLNDFRIDKGSVQEPSETKIKEFSMLNKSVLNLLKTNAEIYNSQKQFIENASHELQTPLAIGINKLELLAGEKDQSPEHIQKIGEIIETFQRLSSLNKSLLLLSKIENKQFISEEELSIDEIISHVLEDFSDYTEYRKIEIKYKKEDSWLIKMNKDLAEILVVNLVKNAIIHNKQGGELRIKLTSSYFELENTSENPERPADNLFERFSKNSDNTSSTGLGLAIVKAIADVSGLFVTYSYNGNHIFKVSSTSF